MNEQNGYSPDDASEEDKDFFDKYSATGESEWSRGSTVPFDDEKVLIERHYNLGGVIPSQGEKETSHPHRKDEWIKEDVRNSLFNLAEIDATEIEIDVKEGVVTLTGKIANRLSKKIAETAAEKCVGVVEVKNELQIGLLTRGLFTH